jgi:hypothetical protein
LSRPRNLGTSLATAEPDAERALDAVHDAHNMPLDDEPKRIIDDLKAVR